MFAEVIFLASFTCTNSISFPSHKRSQAIKELEGLVLNGINRGYLPFEVNTKYSSSSMLKTSEVSRMRSTSKNADVFNSRDEIYLVFAKRK